MTCIPAPACRAALNEATQLAPSRSKASDGICASAAHTQQNPTSDHETGDAWDLTDDKKNGCDVDQLFVSIIARRDKRVKYIIRSRHILRSYDKPGIPAWTWAIYSGPNPHEKHGHVSLLPGMRHVVDPWFTDAIPPPPLPQPEDTDMLKIVQCRDHPTAGEFVTNCIDTVRTVTQDALIHGRNLGYYPAHTDAVPHQWLIWVDQVQAGHHDPGDV